tara:strand:- start:228 stop:629 length:402 start_codon:yes stop_codon:yes gene_type:complete
MEYTTTPMNAEQFLSTIPEARQIALTLRNIGVELILDEETGIKAIGKTSNIDPVLRKRMADHREELIELASHGEDAISEADRILGKATTFLEIETALAKVIDAFDGQLISHTSIEDFHRRLYETAKSIDPHYV